MTDVAEELDARGLNCPLPILKAKKAINSINSGEVLRIIATDPGSVKDFEAFMLLFEAVVGFCYGFGMKNN